MQHTKVGKYFFARKKFTQKKNTHHTKLVYF